MPAPFLRHFFPDLSQPARVQRYIDNHYHLAMVAENSNQIVEYQTQMLRLQYEAAITNIRAIQRQDQTNSLLSALVGGIGGLSDSIDTLNATARQTLDALYEQTEVLEEGFKEIAARMIEQQRVLQQISEILRSPYAAKARELLGAAERSLTAGLNASGCEQEEWYEDAAGFLRKVLDNPLGKQFEVAWFKTGWLKWTFYRNLDEAEKAFSQAVRLSRPNADFFHAYSVWHLAYMQDLQGRPAEAYDTVQQSLRVVPNNHDFMYDTARYAAKTGREREALELLDKCIEIQPQTVLVMFSEEDFN